MKKFKSRTTRIADELEEMRKKIAKENKIKKLDVDRLIAKQLKTQNKKVRREIIF